MIPMRKLMISATSSLILIAGIFSPITSPATDAFTNSDISVGMTATAAGKKTVKFSKHVDGDTSKFIYKGKEITVRYLLTDTPETVHPTKGVEPYGKEASAFTKNALTKAKKIQLDFDKTGEKGDKYGRTLAYVFVDGKDLNKMLISKGLAKVAYVYAPNKKNEKSYLKAQEKAQKAKLGIWSGKNPPKTTETATKAPTKKTYKNCTELRKDYPNGVKKGHSAYQAKMDKDKDGYACEK